LTPSGGAVYFNVGNDAGATHMAAQLDGRHVEQAQRRGGLRELDNGKGFRLRPQGPTVELMLVRNRPTGACVFLLEIAPDKARCGVYAHRPLVELRALTNSPDVVATVATRARIVLWRNEGRQKKDVAALAGVSCPTVDLWRGRYAAEGVAGLLDRSHAAPREQVPARIRPRVLALTRSSPPAETGLSHWSSREMASDIARTEEVTVSHHWITVLWRQNKTAWLIASGDSSRPAVRLPRVS
jgi:transposase